MSSLNETERMVLERALEMSGGYVLDFNNQTFFDFFQRHGVNIDNSRFKIKGDSKAKRMRAFWDQGMDSKVGAVLRELVDMARTKSELGEGEVPEGVLERCEAAVNRLLGIRAPEKSKEEEFLAAEYEFSATAKLPIEPALIAIVERRLREAELTLESGAWLSTVFLCGSLLEAALLGAAIRSPEKFNRASAAPKNGERVKPFPEWKLGQLIDVAEQVGCIAPDIKKFGHAMRDFRNYIHPNAELQANFTPDKHTARLCLQALMAALSDLAGER